MKTARLDSICTRISSGGTPSRKNDTYFTADQSGHLWVKSKELLDCSLSDTEEKITDEGLENSSAKFFPECSILIAMYGANVGQLAWLRKPATVNQAICGLVVDVNQADWRFVFYALMQNRDELTVQAQGAAQQNLNQDAIRQFGVPSPPLPTQRKIAAVLSAYDDLIENNTRRIKILEQMAQSIYREWFVNFRFPGHEKVRMVNSPMGKIPEGWRVVPLAEVAEVNGRSIKHGSEPDEVLYVDIASVSPGRIGESSLLPFEDAPGRARRLVRDGDTIWSCVRPNRRSYALVLDPDPRMVVSTGFAVLSPTAVSAGYLYLAVTTDDFVGYLTNHAQGAAYPAVVAADFEKARLVVPPRAVLDHFDRVGQPILRLCDRMLRKNTVLRRTRDLLLPKLISGEVDVSDLDIAGVA
jgi:type I restriction enzyme S subunit